jgi:23S rRNA (pseudouridine1915-N3)-methyltransferase
VIRIAAVGRVRSPAMRDAAADYIVRIGRFARIEVDEVEDATPAQEARALLARVKGSFLLGCDLRGTGCSSEDFARLIGEHGNLCFVLGGPDGLDESVRARADRLLRLSDFTLPHELARLVLLEQIYRAWTIRQGHPYHR